MMGIVRQSKVHFYPWTQDVTFLDDNNLKDIGIFDFVDLHKNREKDATSLAWHMNRVFFVNNIVPTEHREVTLEEFKTAVEKSFFDKSER